MDFLPKQHLEIGNYIKYVNEILHKCDKGIEYCKICPNEFVCSELEKDDFGLPDSTISDVLTAIQYALSKVPGYLNPDKRSELRARIKNYINESSVQEQKVWEDSILGILLDDKLANPAYKPKAGAGEIRTLFTYNPRIGFSASLKCIYAENETSLQNTAATLPGNIFLNSILAVNQFVRSKQIQDKILPPVTYIKYHLEDGVVKIIQRCNLNDIGLPAALAYYSMLTRLTIPVNIVVTGGLDSRGTAIQAEPIGDKVETVLRELHFIDKIIVPKGAPLRVPVSRNIKIIEVSDLEQTINITFERQ
ncbi:MAG: hypothetical protein HUU08_12305 [Candidatus Brocadia sp.]|nr:hypothetical protein [Candidatus Brocadia sp.]